MPNTPPFHRTQNWSVTKPGASGRRGIVASQSWDAAQAGIAVLDAGGNAVDAAVAAAFALAAVEPWNSGLGGVGFALVHRAAQARAEVVDFGPRAPRGLDPSLFRLSGGGRRGLSPWPEVEGHANVHGPLSFVIPSAVAGCATMLERWGRLPLREVMAPAIALARRGLALDWYTTLRVAESASVLRNYEESARIYLPEGLPPVTPYQGTLGFFGLGALLGTLERLAERGLHDFYDGEVAAAIVEDVRDMGGLLSAEDLGACAAEVRPALDIEWRGRTWQLAGGLTAAPTLARVMDAMRGASYGPTPDAAWFAALAGAMKRAFAERLSDLGEDVAAEGGPPPAGDCTSHLTVCDEDGGMVAMTGTLMSSMGSRVVLPRSGVLMNNGVMWFEPRPGRPNSVGPGKRPLTNMCPVIVREGNTPVLAGGASGGRRIMAAVFQALSFAADFGMAAEEAVRHPRIDVSDADGVRADDRLPADVVEAIRAVGGVELVEHGVLPFNFACPNLIRQVPEGGGTTRTGATDVMSPWSAALSQTGGSGLKKRHPAASRT